MKEYKTYVFKTSKNKARKRLAYNTSVFAGILVIIYLNLVGIMGLGLGLVGAVVLIGTLLKMKLYDDKYMGITAYGDRKEKFYITEDSFLIGETKIPYSELQDLVIYVDEYEGMPRNIFGIHHGGNNEITFTHKGSKVSINYIIKTKEDFKNVEMLVDRIEQQQIR